MLKSKKIIIVIPAYNSENTIAKTYSGIPENIADEIILVDDGSIDNTSKIAEKLNIHLIRHPDNKGYGAALKTGFSFALKMEPDIIIVLHSDNQYPPELIEEMALPIINNNYDLVLASRFLGKNPLKEGMPVFRYYPNRFLTFIQNHIFGYNLSEYHTGYRAYNVKALRQIPYEQNSDDFVYDNELLSQISYLKFGIIEIACPAVYSPEISSINLIGSIIFGLKVLNTCLKFIMHKNKIKKSKLYKINSNKNKEII
jgi:glycosyltransferase involved in cell wall biosynthesis